MLHYAVSLAWLTLAVVIFVDSKRKAEEVHQMFYVAIVCSSIWAAG